MSYRDQVFEYVKERYGVEPEYLWRRYPDYAVFRHQDNEKWFGVVMTVQRNRLEPDGEGIADILNVKLAEPMLADILIQQPGYYRGYHMNRGCWISVLLDGTIPFPEICRIIDTGYLATASVQTIKKERPPKEWIIPANPKYFDIIHAFDDKDVINWKQGNGIKKGDTVFMYVAVPVSAILYQCEVEETDIPYSFHREELTIKALMKIRLKKRFDPALFTFDVLNNEYGIFAVRGPRGIPLSLSIALKKA